MVCQIDQQRSLTRRNQSELRRQMEEKGVAEKKRAFWATAEEALNMSGGMKSDRLGAFTGVGRPEAQIHAGGWGGVRTRNAPICDTVWRG
jgi:hypothetical protein